MSSNRTRRKRGSPSPSPSTSQAVARNTRSRIHQKTIQQTLPFSTATSSSTASNADATDTASATGTTPSATATTTSTATVTASKDVVGIIVPGTPNTLLFWNVCSLLELLGTDYWFDEMTMGTFMRAVELKMRNEWTETSNQFATDELDYVPLLNYDQIFKQDVLEERKKILKMKHLFVV